MSSSRHIDRRSVLKVSALGARDPEGLPTPLERAPALFIGHGSPMNALEDNLWTRSFQALGEQLPRPKAILAISAHWFTPGTFLTGNVRPPTIHDFGGFPQALFEVQYPAPGDPELAARIVGLLGPQRASVRNDWGLDHGTWTVLHHLRPKAEVPVVQLSIDARLHPSEHLALGRALSGLRGEGVLLMGSGNVTRNLRHAFGNLSSGETSTPVWAQQFDADVAKAIEQHDGEFLAKVIMTEAGRTSHPTLDHYLPLLYVAGAASDADKVRFPTVGFDLGSLSMRSVLLG